MRQGAGGRGGLRLLIPRWRGQLTHTYSPRAVPAKKEGSRISTFVFSVSFPIFSISLFILRISLELLLC